VTESSKGKATTYEDTVLKDSISKGICQHCVTRDCATFSQLNGQLPPTAHRRKDTWEYGKRPYIRVLLEQKETRYISGAAEYISSDEIFSFFPTIKIQDPPTFCSK
jgi:hypothetical protein